MNLNFRNKLGKNPFSDFESIDRTANHLSKDLSRDEPNKDLSSPLADDPLLPSIQYSNRQLSSPHGE